MSRSYGHADATSEEQRRRPSVAHHEGAEARQASTSPLGAETLAHLQRTIGNRATTALLRGDALASPGTVQRRGSSSSASDAGAATPARSLADIEANYRRMIAAARSKGYNVAADNLEYWLDGGGGTRTLSVSWLRANDAVTGAEATNQGRFERQLKEHAGRLADGASETFTDHWDRALTAGMTTELYYASGTSELSSRGTFVLTRSGRTVTITGTVTHHWHDPYNWNAGQGAYIPGFGVISDDDALALKAAGRGHDYELVSDWTQTVTGTVDIGYIYNSIDLTWSGP